MRRSLTMGFGLDQLGRSFFSFSFSSSKKEESPMSLTRVSPSYHRMTVRFFLHIVVSHRDFDKVPTRTSKTTEIVPELSWPFGMIGIHGKDEKDVAKRVRETIVTQMWQYHLLKYGCWVSERAGIYALSILISSRIFDLLEGGRSLTSNDFRVLVPGNHRILVYLDINIHVTFQLHIFS